MSRVPTEIEWLIQNFRSPNIGSDLFLAIVGVWSVRRDSSEPSIGWTLRMSGTRLPSHVCIGCGSRNVLLSSGGMPIGIRRSGPVGYYSARVCSGQWGCTVTCLSDQWPRRGFPTIRGSIRRGRKLGQSGIHPVSQSIGTYHINPREKILVTSW